MNMMVSSALVGATAVPIVSPSIAAAKPNVTEPIFAIIEAHKAAHDAFKLANEMRNNLDEQLPAAVTKSSITVWERDIVETDAPEWVAAVINEWETSKAEEEQALALINVTPTTIHGAAALLQYVVEVEQKIGDWWPQDNFADEEIIGRNGEPRTFSWHHFVCRSVLATLTGSIAA